MRIRNAQSAVSLLNYKMRDRHLIVEDEPALLKHLREEVEELAAAPESEKGEEMADVLHILLALAEATDRDLQWQFMKKLAKNNARKWHEPDEDGIIRHASHD